MCLDKEESCLSDGYCVTICLVCSASVSCLGTSCTVVLPVGSFDRVPMVSFCTCDLTSAKWRFSDLVVRLWVWPSVRLNRRDGRALVRTFLETGFMVHWLRILLSKLPAVVFHFQTSIAAFVLVCCPEDNYGTLFERLSIN